MYANFSNVDPIYGSTALPTPGEWRPELAEPLSSPPVALHLFVLGYEPVPESLSYADGRPDRFLLEPVTAAAVEYPNGWVLLDSGFNVDIIRSPELRRRYFNFESYTAVIPPGDPLAEGIRDAGLGWESLRVCAISHSHLDHTGGLRLVPRGVPIVLQRAEYEYVRSLDGISGAVFPDEIMHGDRRIVLADGDTRIAPGLTALDTRGHTPGHQSFQIDLPGASVILAFDAADLEQNLQTVTACGWTVGAAGPAAAQLAVERLAAARLGGVDVWPGHDPDWWHRRLGGDRYLRLGGDSG